MKDLQLGSKVGKEYWRNTISPMNIFLRVVFVEGIKKHYRNAGDEGVALINIEI